MQTSHSPVLPGSLPIFCAPIRRSRVLNSTGCFVLYCPQTQGIGCRRGLSQCCACCEPKKTSKSARKRQHKHAVVAAIHKSPSSISSSSRLQLKRGYAAVSETAVGGSVVASSILAEQPLGPTAEPDVLHNRRIRGMQQRAKRHRSASDSAAVLHKALNVSSTQERTDLLNCLVLSEAAYKVIDMGEDLAAKVTLKLKHSFPAGLVTLQHIQWSLPSVYHRYLIGEDKRTIYLSFMGTKQRRDLVTNAAVLQEPVWQEDMENEPLRKQGAIPAAHRGFLARAKAIPIEGLYAHACRKSKRLVLTGHSLGGAVATLCTLRLLRQLPEKSTPGLACITFACPAIGNPALVDTVQTTGWEPFFRNMLVPEDIVPRLLASPAQTPEQVAAAAIAALQPAETAVLADDAVESTLELFDEIFEVVTVEGSQSELPTASSAVVLGSVDPYVFKAAAGPLARLAQREAKSRNAEQANIAAGRDEDEAREDPDAALGAEVETLEVPSANGLSDEDRAEVALLRGEGANRRREADAAKAGSASAGANGRRLFGRERLTSNQAIFFPWSAAPLPSFAREMVGRALKRSSTSLESLRVRGLPFSRQPTSILPGSTQANSLALRGLNKQQQKEAGPGTSEPRASGPASAAVPFRRRGSTVIGGTSASAVAVPESEVPASGPGIPSRPSSLSKAAIGPTGIVRLGKAAIAGSSVPLTPIKPGRRWPLAGRGDIGRLGANMGRAASGAARGAARIVTGPLRVAQRSYAVFGRQLYIATTGMMDIVKGESGDTFREGLQGATESSRASALALPGSTGASPSTVVSMQLPIAAARRRQPFLMHKMAFHRARVLSIVESCLVEAGLELSPHPHIDADAERFLSERVAPPMRAMRAEVFLPYSLPGSEDLREIIDDLGTLSTLPMPRKGDALQRWQWLKPWRFISGLGWRGTRLRGTVELSIQIRGDGLENCSSVRVHASEENVWCRTEIIYRPQQPAPAAVYARLGPQRMQLVRRAVMLGLWARDAGRKIAAALDRTNVIGVVDCMLVKVYLPVELMRKMENRLLDQSGDYSGLTVHMASDFRSIQVPLTVHGGASWMVSDVRTSSQNFNDWLNQNMLG